MSIQKLAILSAAILVVGSVTGCASKPKETTAQIPVPQAEQQKPSGTSTTPKPPVNVEAIAPGSIQDFVVNVGDRVYFDLDRSDIRADARPILTAQAAWLVRYPPVRIRIEGNADERGTREYNFALGVRRAESVKDFLVSRGVTPDRILTISYGKENPIISGSDEAVWQQNRNAHTSITGGAN